MSKLSKYTITKIFTLVMVFCFTFTQSVRADSLAITDLVFITEPQTVSLNEISGPLTIQTQNNLAQAEKISETNDVELESSSPTGEFVNASGGAVTYTMSKNTSTRTFYYRDRVAGVHTITIKIKGRETGKEFTASQTIQVGGVINTTKNTTATEIKTTNTSAHTSQKETTSIKSAPDFKVDAGRPRVVSVHSPITFKAYSNQTDKKTDRTYFEWSFGDGTSGRGGEIDHVYQFSGDYVVVLNALRNDEEAVARVDVRVIDPRIDIEAGDGYIEIKNGSTDELNLGGFIISVGKNKKIIARDTIVRPKGSVKVPVEHPNTSNSVAVFFPSGRLATQKQESSFLISDPVLRTNMLKEIVYLKEQLAKLEEEQYVHEDQLPDATKLSVDEPKEQIKIDNASTQKALLIDSIKSEKKGVPSF